MRGVAWLVAGALVACGPTRIHPFPDVEAGDVVEPMDVTSRDVVDRIVPSDAVDRPTPDAHDGFDGDAMDVSDVIDVIDTFDAGPSGRCTPMLDGRIGGDWGLDQIVTSNTTPTNWGAGLNELRAIHVCYDAENLYVGIEGTVESSNGMVLYLDRDYDPTGATATGISVFSALQDHAGVLDSRISAALTIGTGSGAFGAEAAWGTAGLASLPSGSTSDGVGLRLFWPAGGPAPDGGTLPDRRSNFAWSAGAATICNPTPAACEIAISWTSLFEAPRPIAGSVAMFVRINSGDGTMSSNQTLPMDDAVASRVVNEVLVLTYGP